MTDREIITGETPEHPNPAIAELLEARDIIVGAVRKTSRDQVDLWRQVPWLALQADGRTGYLDKYSYAYYYGFWDLDVTSSTDLLGISDVSGITVDLETGELMRARSVYEPRAPEHLYRLEESNPEAASEREVLALLHRPELLDAQEVVRHLKEQAKRTYWKGYDIKEVEGWRAEIIEKYDLKLVYSRRRIVTPAEPNLLESQVLN